MPKTGSSAIQVFLARNTQQLIEQSVDYLKIGEVGLGAAGKISSGNGAYLSRCLLPEGAHASIKDKSVHIKQFIKAIETSNSRRGIVSSELFIDADAEELATLLDALRGMGLIPKCFYYIRSQVQFLASHYMQQVKRHSCTQLPEIYTAQVFKHIGFLRYASFFNKVASLFKPGNVMCRVYDKATVTHNGIFSAMLAALNISEDGLDFSTGDVNTSLSVQEIAIMLMINQFSPRMNFSDMVVENAIQAGRAVSGQTHNFFPRKLVDDIESFFEEENATLARGYFHRAALFPDQSSPEPVDQISIDNVSTTELIRFFGGLLVRYDEKITQLAEQINLRK